jgi:hypothetical protein
MEKGLNPLLLKVVGIIDRSNLLFIYDHLLEFVKCILYLKFKMNLVATP